AVHRPGMERCDRDTIKQAEAARPCLFRMMPWRPDSAKRVLGPALHHFIDGENTCAHSAQHRLPGAWRHDRIAAVQRDETALGPVFLEEVEIAPGMCAQDLLSRGSGGFDMKEILKFLVR